MINTRQKKKDITPKNQKKTNWGFKDVEDMLRFFFSFSAGAIDPPASASFEETM